MERGDTPVYTMVPIMFVPNRRVKVIDGEQGHGEQEEDGATKAAGKTSPFGAVKESLMPWRADTQTIFGGFRSPQPLPKHPTQLTSRCRANSPLNADRIQPRQAHNCYEA